MRVETWTSRLEHDELGELELLWTWREHADGSRSPRLLAVQPTFDVPAEVVEDLIEQVRCPVFADWAD